MSSDGSVNVSAVEVPAVYGANHGKQCALGEQKCGKKKKEKRDEKNAIVAALLSFLLVQTFYILNKKFTPSWGQPWRP